MDTYDRYIDGSMYLSALRRFYYKKIDIIRGPGKLFYYYALWTYSI